jgi:hypothetical protein
MGTYNMVITDNNQCTYNYTFNITDCVGVEELDQASVIVFPNPSNGTFAFTHEVLQNAFWSLYDISGKLIQSERITSGGTPTFVNVNVPSGIYSLRIVSEDMQIQKSVVVE